MAHFIHYTTKDGDRRERRFPAGTRDEHVRQFVAEVRGAGATHIERRANNIVLPGDPQLRR